MDRQSLLPEVAASQWNEGVLYVKKTTTAAYTGKRDDTNPRMQRYMNKYFLQLKESSIVYCVDTNVVG